MRGAIIYFSGTGNTEYVAKLFKNKFGENGIDCSLVDITKKRSLNTEYDFYIFGCPVYAETIPDYFSEWVRDKVNDVQSKRCIVFSTQIDEADTNFDEFEEILKAKGLKIEIKDFIKMPNNYYLEMFEKSSLEEVKALKEVASEKVSILVGEFVKEKKYLDNAAEEKVSKEKTPYKKFYDLTREWAKFTLTVNYSLCVKCGKCAKNCPTRNISMKDQITFNDKCISCQKCIHKCPVNAFLYKGEKIDQYKV